MLDKHIKAEVQGNGNITIQGVEGSTITINPSNTEEVIAFLIKFQDIISSLPTKILNMLKTNESSFDEKVKGVKIHLSMGLILPELNPEERDATLKVYITNLEKIHRYCHQPYFKLSKPVKFSKGSAPHDTFVLFQNEYSKIQFPKRLEFGQQLIADFQLVKNQFILYEQLDDGESYIQAFCSTTLGELYSSNKYIISKFIKDYNQFMGEWK